VNDPNHASDTPWEERDDESEDGEQSCSPSNVGTPPGAPPATLSTDESEAAAKHDREVTDDAIIDALVTGRSQSEAGRAAGRSERTVRRRLRDPDFLARLAEAREEHSLRQRARSAAWKSGPRRRSKNCAEPMSNRASASGPPPPPFVGPPTLSKSTTKPASPPSRTA